LNSLTIYKEEKGKEERIEEVGDLSPLLMGTPL
jgi:hypothetical protein